MSSSRLIDFYFTYETIAMILKYHIIMSIKTGLSRPGSMQPYVTNGTIFSKKVARGPNYLQNFRGPKSFKNNHSN